MNSVKPLQWAGILLGSGLALYFIYSHLQYFRDVSLLGGILLLELIVASLWNYDQRFFVLLMGAFVWAGIGVPLQGAWTAGRWVVLSAGAVAGFIIWTRTPRGRFGSLHLVAFFCICAAFVSATVSPYTQMASLKALSLLLLFTYCASGARLAVLGREDRFFRGLLWGCETTVYVTAFCYLGLGKSFWGNPNSLGAVMSVGIFPILLWGWFTSEGRTVRSRRLAALLLCTYLVNFSMARAGMIAVVAVTLVFCLCLRQYRLLVKVVGLVLLVVAVTGILAPDALSNRLGDLKDTLLYKGHKEEGTFGSRRTPWEKTMASIKEHPWFGTGYGTSPTGEDPGLDFGTIRSSAETAREHGSSYMTITEWVGLLGVLPFVALLAAALSNVWKVCTWMRRTANPRHYSIPLAMVVLAGLVDASFEDWLFAVGYYLCVFFWAFAFVLADFVPDAVVVPVAGVASRTSHRSPSDLGAAVPTR
ncbi:MAG: O-antigen ligase family protein [Terriglobales bacterium]|jgi:O-antigen ligase